MDTSLAAPMRLVDLTSFYPPHLGGVEAFALGLHRALLERRTDLEIVVVTSDRGGGAPEEVLGPRLRVIRYPSREPVTSFVVPRAGALRAALARGGVRDADIVVSHTRFYPASLQAGKVARELGARRIHIEHGATFVQAGGPLVRGVARVYDATLGRRTLRSADALLAVSSAAASFVGDLSGRDAGIIHRGPDIAPGTTWNATGVRRVLFVGRLVDSKGVHDLIEALALLDDVHLMLVGDGPEAGAIQTRARARGLSDRVHLAGRLEPDEVHRLMADGAVFVNPSLTEGLPTTVLEAAAIGAPIVATNVGGTDEIVEHGVSGVLVEPRDPGALAAAIESVLADGEYAATLGDAARLHVQRSFNWSTASDVLLAAAGVPPRDHGDC